VGWPSTTRRGSDAIVADTETLHSAPPPLPVLVTEGIEVRGVQWLAPSLEETFLGLAEQG
jgi:hypothetical protein